MSEKKEVKKSAASKRGKAENQEAISYRLKCAKTANGLSHFVMYGDVPKGKAVL